MSVKFIIRWDDDDKQLQEMERLFEKDAVSIGRSIRNDLCIPDRFASGFHARLELKDKSCILYDLGSTNGTLLNGEKLKANGHKVIKSGDVITIAKIEIECELERKPRKPTPKATSLMHESAYESFCEISNHYNIPPFEREKDLKLFLDRLGKVLEIFFTEFSINLETYSKLLYELDIHATQKSTQKYNPLKLGKSGKEIAKYLLDWNGDDALSTISFFKEACKDLACSQSAILRILESVLPALLEKTSPETIQRDIQSNKRHQGSYKIYLEKLTKQKHKDLWDEYVRRHRELTENKNKRFEIIKDEFQKIYLTRIIREL